MIFYLRIWYRLFLFFLVVGNYNASFYSQGFTPDAAPARKIGSAHDTTPTQSKLSNRNNDEVNQSRIKEDLEMEARQMLAKAKAIRESFPVQNQHDTNLSLKQKQEETSAVVGYRLYFDIGREEGTWMDPKWGRSGRRIEGSMDVYFHLPHVVEGFDVSLADECVMGKMIKDNIGKGSSTAVRKLDCSKARLRKGFDQMACHGGGYRIDFGNGATNQSQFSSSTVRFFIDVDGTTSEKDSSSSYGDIFIPKGPLYFSLPCFGQSINQLSRKDGIISVRQVGWHTGWRRTESRIVGVFRVVPIQDTT